MSKIIKPNFGTKISPQEIEARRQESIINFKIQRTNNEARSQIIKDENKKIALRALETRMENGEEDFSTLYHMALFANCTKEEIEEDRLVLFAFFNNKIDFDQLLEYIKDYSKLKLLGTNPSMIIAIMITLERFTGVI
jgi:hypothetical protein